MDVDYTPEERRTKIVEMLAEGVLILAKRDTSFESRLMQLKTMWEKISPISRVSDVA